MKIFKNIAKGSRFKIIGFIVFFSCWIIPLILTDGFEIQGHIDMIIMLVQMGAGGFLILFGDAINKRESNNPNYEIPKNIFRVFKAWQILLIITALVFVLLEISIFCEFGWMNSILAIVMYGFATSTAVVGIIQHKKNKKDFVSVGNGKMIRTSSPVSASIRCNGCNKLLNPNDLRAFEGKKYCSSCYMNAFAKKQIKDESGNSKPLQCHCSICNRVFPQSSFHIVNDKFICDECFQKVYSVNL